MDIQKKEQLKRILYTRSFIDLMSKYIILLCVLVFFLPVAFCFTILTYCYMYNFVHPETEFSVFFQYFIISLCVVVGIAGISFFTKIIVNIIFSLLEKIALSKENSHEYYIKQDIIRIKRETHCTVWRLFESILKIIKITITILVIGVTIISCIPYICIWFREADLYSLDNKLTLFLTITSFILGPIIYFVCSNHLLKKEIKNIKASIDITQNILFSKNKPSVSREPYHPSSNDYYSYHHKPKSRRRTFTELSKIRVDEMTGVEFENYCATLLPYSGYSNIEGTKVSGDQGVDLTAFKGGINYAIQCKRYNSKVSNKAVQEVIAGMKVYNCEKSMVMTTNYYTKSAQELAEIWDVILIDRDKLENMQQHAIAAQAAISPDSPNQ